MGKYLKKYLFIKWAPIVLYNYYGIFPALQINTKHELYIIQKCKMIHSSFLENGVPKISKIYKWYVNELPSSV